MNFETLVAEAVHFFTTQSISQPIRIISNKDTDGITAAAILVAALRNRDQPSVTTFIKQLTPDFLTTLEHEPYTVYFFLDHCRAVHTDAGIIKIVVVDIAAHEQYPV